MKVLVTGANGYVGHHVISALLEAGHAVTGLSRGGAKSHTASGKDLGSHNQARYLIGDVATGAGLSEAMQGQDAVIHLVGIIAEKAGQTFQSVHVEGTRNVINAAQAAGIQRYAHMSALGADPNSKSRYSSSKAEAEALVRASPLTHTILQPSLIFGQGDDFFGRVLRNLVSQGPVVPQIGDGQFPFRPVWVGDVAQAFVQSLTSDKAVNQTIALVGPKQYTFRELLQLELDALGAKKPFVPVPIPVMDVAVPMMQLLGPLAPITKDQYAMLKAGNTGDPTTMNKTFNLEMRTLESELPKILGRAPSVGTHAKSA